jgi:predicted nuclease of predicted toxin-antitoxin system
VKLLLDENLSFRLVKRIEDLFPQSTHVFSVGLGRVPDSEIWQFARTNGFAILSADADFYELATTLGSPPKVVWLLVAITQRRLSKKSCALNQFESWTFSVTRIVLCSF